MTTGKPQIFKSWSCVYNLLSVLLCFLISYLVLIPKYKPLRSNNLKGSEGFFVKK